MASVIDICNLALSNIRAGSINSLDESSLQAQQCKLRYEFLRDHLLEEVPWQFARRVEPLSLTTEDLFNWAYAYQYPADCMRINRVILNIEEIAQGQSDTVSRRILEGFPQPSLNRQVEYKIYNNGSSKLIASNQPELHADFNVRVTDPNLYPSQFIMAFSYLLASELAIPIAGTDAGRALRSDSLQLYKSYLAAVTSADLNEQFTPVEDSDFITVRA